MGNRLQAKRLHAAVGRFTGLAIAALITATACMAAGRGGEEQGMQTETKEQRDARMAWWREARFGLFIHWGLYAIPAGAWNGHPVPGIGEWIMHNAKVPVADYAALVSRFNPTQFDADAWASLAKRAGMRYIVITSKHHDGFALFPSAVTDYDIASTPFGRDPLAELADACKRHGLKLGFYYSQAQDWRHPGGAAAGGRWDPAQEGDMTEYIRSIAVPQVREILTNYGPIAVLWWDTPVDMTREQADLLLPLLDLQPGIITNNRLGAGIPGDTETPEQFVPPTGFPGGRDWETCMTMNDTWGFKADDRNWKSAETLVRTLIDVVSKGGNFLLNVGPTAEGVIPPESVERLGAVGAWMDINNEAVYGAAASPFRRLEWGRCTRRGDTLYLHVFDWPSDGRLIVPLRNPARDARLLATPQARVDIAKTDEGLVLNLPADARAEYATVVAIRIEGEPDVLPSFLSAGEDGSYRLEAYDADILGSTARLEGHGQTNIGYWTDAADIVQWTVKFDRPGSYSVRVIYACPPDVAGGTFELAVGATALAGTTQPTQHWADYRTDAIGTLLIDAAGRATLQVRPVSMPGGAMMNLRTVVLEPVR